jgi:hypothetical protein
MPVLQLFVVKRYQDMTPLAFLSFKQQTRVVIPLDLLIPKSLE